MPILTFPTLTRTAPHSLEWMLASNTQTFASPLSQSVQTVELPGARWAATFSLDNLTEADAALLQSFLAQLRGGAGRFYLHNFARPIPRGSAGGTPLVAGGSQTGATLTTDGWPVSTTVLKAGDFFGVNGELKMAVADVTSDGSGNASITFEPPLRASPADNAAITTTRPTCIMRLTEPTSRWTTAPGKFTSFSISCIESFT